MLEILQTRNKEKYKDKLSELKLDFDMSNVVEADDSGVSLGFGVYHFGIDENFNPLIEIDYVFFNDDLLLLDGIVRSILFLAMMKGIDRAKFNLQNTNELVSLGFVQNNYNYLDSIAKFMSKCKSCKN